MDEILPLTLNLSKDNVSFLELGNCTLTRDGKFFYLPFYFRELPNGTYQLFTYDRLPKSIKQIVDENKNDKMKHLKQLAFNVVQWRLGEYFVMTAIPSIVICVVAESLTPLIGTITLPFLILLISEHKKFKSTGKY